MRCCDNKLNNFLDVLGLPPLPYDEAGTLLAISTNNELIRVEKPTIEISVSWDDITDKPTTLGGYGITDALTKDESDERYAFKEHTHIVEDIVDFPETWDWDDLTGAPQSTPQEIDNTVALAHTHENKALLDSLNINDNGYITYDDKTLSTFNEGILFLDSKYFTPVDNGSGNLVLNGITWEEIQLAYTKYSAGLISIQTNTNGYVNHTVDSFIINDAIISFVYRWALADYANGKVNIYRALISATEANIVTPVELLYSFELSDNNFTDFYKNLIETTNQQTQENTTAIEALKGAIIYIGEINLNTENVTQQALTDRAAELGYPTLQRGYTLVDLDNNQWTYNGTQWINMGNNNVSTATNETLGVVKGSTDNLKVSVDLVGEMSVNGLEGTLNNKADKGTTLMDYGIMDAYNKNEVDAIAGLYVKKSGDTMTGELNGTAVNLSGNLTFNRSDTAANNIIKNVNGSEVARLSFNSGGVVTLGGIGNAIQLRPAGFGSTAGQTLLTQTQSNFTTNIITNGSVTATSIVNSTSNNNEVLLGGGGTKALSDFVTTSTTTINGTSLNITTTEQTALSGAAGITGYRDIKYTCTLYSSTLPLSEVTQNSQLFVCCIVRIKVNGTTIASFYADVPRSGTLEYNDVHQSTFQFSSYSKYNFTSATDIVSITIQKLSNYGTLNLTTTSEGTSTLHIS